MAERSLITEAGFVAAAPALAYAMGYLYEVSFCEVFQILPELIRIDAGNIFRALRQVLATVLVVAFVMTMGVVIELAIEKRRRQCPRPGIIAEYAGGVVATIGLAMFASTWSRQAVYAVLCLGGVAMGASALFNWPNAPLTPRGRFWGRTLTVTSALALALVFSSINGGQDARKQVVFHIVPGSPELAVLRIYGDTVVAAPLDRKKRRVSREQRLLPLSGLTMLPQAVGPLALK